MTSTDDDDAGALGDFLAELITGPLTDAADHLAELLREAAETDPESDNDTDTEPEG